jgi:hypothetical protein
MWQNHWSNLISDSSKYLISNATSSCFSLNTFQKLVFCFCFSL